MRSNVSSATRFRDCRYGTSVPAAIPIKLDNQYFALNQSGELWNAIMLSRQIAVHAPGEIVEPRMELLIVLE